MDIANLNAPERKEGVPFTPSTLEPKRPIIVVKIGTSTIMREAASSNKETVSAMAGRSLDSGSGELAVSTIGLLVDTLLALRRDGNHVILITSGAVGVGCRELGIPRRPSCSPDASNEERARVLADIQGLAAIGQSVLMRTYYSLMAMANQTVAQVLLTSGDLGSEYQYHNAKNTLLALLNMGVIPIVNENDTTATEEIKYGDNDWLSALVSSAIGAKWLFLLTDVDQLYTANPRVDPNAKPINVVPNVESLNVNLKSNATGTQWGTGGMKTKITAARLATAAGVKVCLLHGRHPSRVLDFVSDNSNRLGTVFEPLTSPLDLERKKWISNCLPPRGEIIVSDKAAVLMRAGLSLRALGVVGCEGAFEANSAVRIRGTDGLELARGISNYSSLDLMQFKGMNSNQIFSQLGFPMSEKVVHEDNLALLVDSNVNADDEDVSSQLANDQFAVSPVEPSPLLKQLMADHKRLSK